jgi:hypothetical protein
VIAITDLLARLAHGLGWELEEGSPMKQKIILAFAAAAIGFAMIALAQASIWQGHAQRASAGPAFHLQVLQPVF